MSLLDLTEKVKNFLNFTLPQKVAQVASNPTLNRVAQGFQNVRQTPARQFFLPTALSTPLTKQKVKIAGQYLQKFPDTSISSPQFKGVGFNIKQPDITKFITSLPGQVIRDYGNTAVKYGTGQKFGVWDYANVSDFVPGLGFIGGGVKAVEKQGAKTLTKKALLNSRKGIRIAQKTADAIQTGNKVMPEQLVRGLSKSTSALGEVASPSLARSIEKGKLNINRLNIKGAGKKVLKDLEKTVTPTVIGNKEVVKLARTAKGTRALTDEQMTKIMAQQLKNRQQVVDLTAKFNQLKKSGASEQELAKVMVEIADQSRVARQGGTFAGRILQAQNIIADKSASPMQRVFALLDNAGVSEKTYMKNAVKVNWDDAVDVVRFYRQYVPPKFGEILTEVRYSNMLSSPLTHIINTASNALQTGAVTPVEKTLTGILDWGKHLLTGAERKYYASAGIDYGKGYVKSLPDAFKKAWNILSGNEISIRPDFEYIPTSTRGALKAYTTPLRALEAMDQFFKTLVEGGVTAELKKSPIKLTKTQIAKQASDEATYRLFRQAFDPTGELGQGVVLRYFDMWNSAIANLRRLPGGKWILPFLQTPTNILKQGIEYSPLGFTTAIKAAKPTEQISKALIGSSVFVGAYQLAKSGLLSWEAPTGDTERSLYYDAGLQPYSVKIGNKWVSFSKLGPLSYPLAMAAALHNAEKNRPDRGTLENIGRSVMGMLGFFGDQSYVRSIGDLVDAIQGGVNIGPTAVSSEAANLAGQLIPYRSFLTWLGRITDPTYRKAKTFGEKMIKDLPVLGEKLKPYTNLQGLPSMRDFPLLNAVSPYKVSQEKPSIGMYRDYEKKKIDKAIEKRADEEFAMGGGKQPQSGNIFRYIDDNGSVKKIDLSFPMPEYKPTGNQTLDKELLTDYRGKLTSLKNQIVKAWELGAIDQEKAIELLEKAESARITSAKTKSAKKISISAPKITFQKIGSPKAMATVKPVKLAQMPKLKRKNYKTIKIKVSDKKYPAIKIKPYTNTLSNVGVKLA